MAEANAVQEVGGQLVQRIFSSILWVGLALVVVGVIGFLMWWFLVYKKKFNIDVKIISKRAKDKNNILFDKAAILTDRKTKTKFFSLWQTKVDLPLPSFNILQKTDKGDYIEIYRTGEDQFYYLLPPKINNVYVTGQDGKVYPIGQQVNNIIDPDLAFWAVKRKGMNHSMFNPESLLMKILPYIPHIIAGVLVIFILYILMSHLPGILSQLRELTAELNRNQAAQVITG